MAMMKQGLHEETEGKAKASKDEAMQDAARFGVARGGVLQKRFAGIDRSKRADYTKGVRSIMIEKAKAEFDDKITALNGTQKWLDSKRQYDIGLKQIAATIQSAQIQASATVAAAGISARATRDAARAGAGAARHAANLGHERWKTEFSYRQEQDKAAAARTFAGDAGM
jgi:hypothetical protein